MPVRPEMPQINRRQILGSLAAALAASPLRSHATVIQGELPWSPQRNPLPPRDGEGWHYLTPEEAAAVEALVDRLIPPDPETPGGKDAGCAVFIDRQLAGAYGSSEGLYTSGPFHEGTKEQGPQSATTPAEQYRAALTALDQYCRRQFNGTAFAALSDAQKDAVIVDLESGKIPLGDKPGSFFFKLILNDTRQGFFTDPIYGGNRGMVAWKMIGFPGARYDYRDWVERHNERYPHPPIGLADHPDWKE